MNGIRWMTAAAAAIVLIACDGAPPISAPDGSGVAPTTTAPPPPAAPAPAPTTPAPPLSIDSRPEALQGCWSGNAEIASANVAYSWLSRRNADGSMSTQFTVTPKDGSAPRTGGEVGTWAGDDTAFETRVTEETLPDGRRQPAATLSRYTIESLDADAIRYRAADGHSFDAKRVPCPDDATAAK